MKFLLRHRLPPLLTPLLALAACLAAGPAGAQKTIRACPDWLDASAMKRGASYTCRCPAEIKRHGAYGVFRYAPESHICTAARHDGRIGLRGGVVTLQFGAGCGYFREAWRNGIQSRNAPARPVSYAFVRPLPPCSPKTPARRQP